MPKVLKIYLILVLSSLCWIPSSLMAQGTLLANGARDIGEAGAAYTHPRLYFSQSDAPAILARRSSSEYYTEMAEPRISGQINHTTNNYAELATADLTTPDWSLIETYFSGNDGRNQAWGISSFEAWLTTNATLKTFMIDTIVNYAKMINYSKDLADGVYPSSVVSTDFYNTVVGLWYGTNIVDDVYSWNWNLDEQWAFGGAGYALSYDVLYNDMTVAQRDTVRSAIAAATTDRYSYGATMPKGRGISNHYGYHGELAALLCAIKGETGFDTNSYDRIRQVLLDYWEVGFTPEGQCHEDTYGPNLGMREGSRGLVAIARANTNDNIFVTEKYKNFAEALAQQIDPRPNGNLTGGASGTDQGNHSGGNSLYETSFIISKYMRPSDPVVDYNWRWILGDNFENQHKGQCVLDFVVFGLDVNSSFAATNSLAGTGLDLTFYSPRRGKLTTRSDWSQEALFFNFDARPDAFGIGHDKTDRGVFHLSARRKPWVLNPNWQRVQPSEYQSLVHIDGVAQAYKAPSVEMLSQEDDGTHVMAVADLEYAYDWEWSPPWPATNDSRYVDAAWSNEVSDPRDLGWPDDPSWLPTKIWGEPGIGYIGSYMKKRAYNSVDYAFRSIHMARGNQPYVLIFDDIKKDTSTRTYRWQMAVDSTVQIDSYAGRDIILGHSDDPGGAKLLLRVLQANDATDATPMSFIPALTTATVNGYDSRVVSFSVDSKTPRLKVLLAPFEEGERPPITTLDTGNNTLMVMNGYEQDLYTMTNSASGLTTYGVERMSLANDSDGDFMDDTWETTHFGGISAVNGGATEDWDNDGVNNLAEFEAGTDPTDSSAFLQFTDVSYAVGNVTLEWSSDQDGTAPTRTYDVYRSAGEYSTLAVWALIASDLPSGGGQTTYVDDVSGLASSHYMYRVVGHGQASAKTPNLVGLMKRTLVEGRNHLTIPFEHATPTLTQLIGSAQLPAATTESAATVVDLWDQAAQAINTRYWLSSAVGFEGWRESGSFGDASMVAMDLDKGLMVTLRSGAGAQSLSVVGFMPDTAKAQTVRDNGYSLCSSGYPKAVIASELGLEADGFSGGASIMQSDWLLVSNPSSGEFDQLIWYDSVQGVWRDIDSSVSDTQITPGNTLLMFRRSRGSDINWTQPIPYLTPVLGP